ncbi:ABC transporter permease [Vibrio nigripulchritudo]|uniref:ABC transporter permease n=1 Tax=Vibrio nigripulchritudo TaxID=28173 RepID=UPI0003B20A31|nr:ABC transporter permease [Vibrio nigripulchritudo]CCN70284.1 ABC transporter [Vibrio nigripulchritudo SFn118]
MQLLLSTIETRKVLLSLVLNEFKLKYFNNSLGMLWAFAQPLTTILVLWFVFQVGFKAVPVDNVPFILWLSAGMIPWFFISDSINSGSSCIVSNEYLVKKVFFRVEVLPLVSILSNLIIHLFFIFLLLFMFILYGYNPNIYWIQIPYYIIASSTIVLAISMITSSLIVFIHDVKHIVGVMIQFGFWLTPIFWNLELVPTNYVNIVKLNPLIHIIDGYRGALIGNQWFWEQGWGAVYFWIFALIIFFAGNFTFKKLRPSFADVI